MSTPEPHRRRQRGPASTPSRTPSTRREKSGQADRLIAPTKAETAQLPPFAGLPLSQIHVPVSHAECRSAVDEILAAGTAGFDTEARPTFRVGQKSDGPHVVQFALTDKAFIFQLHHHECEQASAELIASKQLLKVGFGLKNDHGQIRDRLGITLHHVLDLDQVFRKQGYRGQIGVRGAIGVLLKQGFKKSKSVTTSNWSLPKLSPAQLLYAANDAYAALKIMEALQKEGLLES
ncbi:3'-5' exonuclease [Haloferula chungangensis]|uniref:3'-5' exonuclease n=1 Tax=Haloferula chungangensis TaxID=1048331 RepID=A0ABW2L701_9BACT